MSDATKGSLRSGETEEVKARSASNPGRGDPYPSSFFCRISFTACGFALPCMAFIT
jgi:hypothetical protein